MLVFLPKWVSDISSILTVLAFIITLVQILNIKSTTTKIEEEVKSTQSKIQKVLAISDLSKSSETIKTIFAYLRGGNYDMAYAKIMEINDIIIEIKEVPALRNLNYIHSLEAYGKYLATDLKKFQESIIFDENGINRETLNAISSDLLKISELFAKINSQLKHNTDEG